MRTKFGICLSFLILVLSCNVGSIRTPSPEIPVDSLYRFVAIGDSRGGPSVYAQLLRQIVSRGQPEYLVHLGDIISNPEFADEFPLFLKITDSYISSDRFFPIVGNHDSDDSESLDAIRSAFPIIPEQGYYMRKLADCFCLFLTSETASSVQEPLGPGQTIWLKEQLGSDQAKEAKLRMVFIHRPLYPFGHHKDEPLNFADELHAILKDGGVNMVFSGHEHQYGRTEKDGVVYIVSGGGGSPPWLPAGKDAIYHYVRINILEASALVQTISLTGRVHDEFTIEF